jgi:hypothetical protein
MGSDDADSKRGRPAYTLTPAERKYLQTGDPGSYRESRLEDNIQDKVESLGQRVNDLVADVEALGDAGYLDSDNTAWKKGWLQLMGFGESGGDDNGKAILADAIYEFSDIKSADDAAIEQAVQYANHAEGTTYSTSSPLEFGKDLGRLSRQLMVYPNTTDRDEILRDLIWGFINGSYISHRPASKAKMQGRQERISEVIQHAQMRLEDDIRFDMEIEERMQQMQEHSDRSTDFEIKLRSRLSDVLAAEGFETKDSGWNNDFKSFEERRTGEKPSKEGVWLEKLIGCFKEYKIKEKKGSTSDSPRNSFGQQVLFQTLYPIGETSVDDLVSREEVLEVLDEYNLVARGKLQRFVHTDKERLKETTWRGVPANDVLTEIAEAGGEVSSVAVAQQLEGAHKSQVTKICNDLAGREWDRPLMEGDASGWWLTDYGELLSDKDYNIYFSAGGPTAEAAIDELDIPKWEYTPAE